MQYNALYIGCTSNHGSSLPTLLLNPIASTHLPPLSKCFPNLPFQLYNMVLVGTEGGGRFGVDGGFGICCWVFFEDDGF